MEELAVTFILLCFYRHMAEWLVAWKVSSWVSLLRGLDFGCLWLVDVKEKIALMTRPH